jgi:uroporphyrinogen-III synthase
MMPDRPLLLITRPEPAAGRFAREAGARFGDRILCLLSPLTRTEAVAGGIPLDGIGGLIFTSERAVEVFAAQSRRRDLPAWVVGPRTAAAARTAGLVDVRQGPGTAADLAGAIAASAETGRLLYLRGRVTSFPLEETLMSAGLPVTPLVIYDQTACDLTAEARQALVGTGRVIVPLFSVLSARRFGKAAAGHKAQLDLVAISPAVAAVAALIPSARLSVAASPDGAGVLDRIAATLEG